ncbi:MAG: hypothetical protein ACOYXU_14700 [Nitrospirota bacterium]
MGASSPVGTRCRLAHHDVVPDKKTGVITRSDFVDLLVPSVVLLMAFVVNVGAGRFRARSVKFSVWWLLWIHLPVLAIFPVRWWAGLSVWFIPLLVAAALAGQWVGGRLVRNT